ncbi:hypothetical protein BP5796_07742 [Coleophoma crateriformis]|uniref:Uncharacterized protein n=1 Tax=Coleophoma crateriformis TaxID=565419 RepID=A0A3D8RCR2_9HELO|nr:hypothetical protein BP5796_07742 [Coleophoma crateriformis]
MASLYQPLRAEDEQSEHISHEDDSSDILEDDMRRKTRDPLYVLILYGISFLVSIGGLGAAIAGYSIVITSPFDEDSKKMEEDSYETYFWGMQSVVILLYKLTINIFWTGLNFSLALKAKQNHLWFLNMIYDFLMWATLIAFGVLNMVEMLWDRRLCDGWDDSEMYNKCDIAMFRLLVVEMVAVNLGLLAAVLHFILLVARCCTQGRRNTETISLHLRRRVQEEEQLLLSLMERRRQLIRENQALEARRLRVDRDLPPLPTEGNDFGIFHENSREANGEQHDVNLIDVSDVQTHVVEETYDPAAIHSDTQAPAEDESQQTL